MSMSRKVRPIRKLEASAATFLASFASRWVAMIAGEPALAATAHQVGHGAERELARLVRNVAGDGRREQLRLVHHHQHRVPVVAVDIEQPAEEGGRAPHLVLGVEPFEIEHGGDAMDARALACDLQAALGMVLGIDHEMAETLGQRHEVAFGIDDGLLHPGRALFQQPAQQMGFAGARIALHQQAGRQQFLEIQSRRGARRRVSHLDRNGHVSTQRLTCGERLIKPIAARRATMADRSMFCTAIRTRSARRIGSMKPVVSKLSDLILRDASLARCSSG